uniref:Secreted protein n=1 Tax=Lutzomyia longipalpis TaxID=7200 RepID=A0A7G3B345_LUTLO
MLGFASVLLLFFFGDNGDDFHSMVNGGSIFADFTTFFHSHFMPIYFIYVLLHKVATDVGGHNNTQDSET